MRMCEKIVCLYLRFYLQYLNDSKYKTMKKEKKKEERKQTSKSSVACMQNRQVHVWATNARERERESWRETSGSNWKMKEMCLMWNVCECFWIYDCVFFPFAFFNLSDTCLQCRLCVCLLNGCRFQQKKRHIHIPSTEWNCLAQFLKKLNWVTVQLLFYYCCVLL